MNLELAYEQSLLRVFGDAPGAYGAGVNNFVVSKKWSDVTDLGKVYTTWAVMRTARNTTAKRCLRCFRSA